MLDSFGDRFIMGVMSFMIWPILVFALIRRWNVLVGIILFRPFLAFNMVWVAVTLPISLPLTVFGILVTLFEILGEY